MLGGSADLPHTHRIARDQDWAVHAADARVALARCMLRLPVEVSCANEDRQQRQ
jgi:hypothetical protein